MEIEITNKQKQTLYISLFTIFGLLVGLFVAGFVQVIYTKFLLADFVTYSFGLSWAELDQFGQLVSALLVLASGLWGWVSGQYWWKQIYVLKRFRQKR